MAKRHYKMVDGRRVCLAPRRPPVAFMRGDLAGGARRRRPPAALAVQARPQSSSPAATRAAATASPAARSARWPRAPPWPAPIGAALAVCLAGAAGSRVHWFQS
jgi:hypothetical protein